MIDSLFDLIVAAFIASLPILLAIIRSRRNRTGRGRMRRTGKETDGAEEAVDSGARDTEKRKGWAGGFFRRLRRETAPERNETPTAPPEPERPKPRRPQPSREEGDAIEGLEAERREAGAGGGERLLERVDPYPPLQRAVILKELLGPPKSLE